MGDTRTAGTLDEAREGFTAQERAAMKERAKEVRRSSRRGGPKADPEAEVLEKIAEMAEGDRLLAARVHEIVRAAAPGLTPRLWYGMPAYSKDGKVLCFFKCAGKFGTRYSEFGFSDVAALDEGAFWPSAYALTEITDDVAERLTALVRRAAG
ncbi:MULTISPECIES: DUF1801 domain-containing protein [Streptomyces]|uniref:iron chaperone n=1 Tax=Streptomyces TaxID=1883 RepID=UPI00140AA6C9|nr:MULTISPECIES: DUF1801 domain-containing protein [Streptomyces]MDH6223213.1 hypothetical protein [Streptomyces sp. MJP52]